MPLSDIAARPSTMNKRCEPAVPYKLLPRDFGGD